MRRWPWMIGWTAAALALSSVSDRSAFGRQSTSVPGGPPTVVVCSGNVENETRDYALQRLAGPTGPSWQLTMQRGSGGKNRVTLPLPRAAPDIEADHVTLAYKTANGGRQVTLNARAGQSALDVYVDFGLEVNVDANLDPRVDEMNTHGSLAVRCTINAAAVGARP